MKAAVTVSAAERRGLAKDQSGVARLPYGIGALTYEVRRPSVSIRPWSSLGGAGATGAIARWTIPRVVRSLTYNSDRTWEVVLWRQDC
jgi:hypothetical protein